MKKRNGIAAFFVVTLLLITPALSAQTTWYVDDDAPNDPAPGDPDVSDPLEDGSSDHPFDAIEEGIDASAGGDTVLITDGNYTGEGNRDLDFGGKAITVMSENGPANCVIDCEASPGTSVHRGFDFHDGEGEDSVLQGLTIQNGYISVGNGGGIRCRLQSNPTIRDCLILSNGSHHMGGGCDQ